MPWYCAANTPWRHRYTNMLFTARRAGWTATIQFFELRDLETGRSNLDDALFTMVDLPGYGPAVADARTKARWSKASRHYLRTRQQLVCAFVLIDASLGPTEDDIAFLDLLDRGQNGKRLVLLLPASPPPPPPALLPLLPLPAILLTASTPPLPGKPVQYHVVLTKADLLTPLELAQSYMVIQRELLHRPGHWGEDMPMTSATNRGAHAGGSNPRIGRTLEELVARCPLLAACPAVSL